MQEYYYDIGMAEPVVSRVQQVKATAGMALGGVNRKAHCKNRWLPEMVGMAILTLGSRQEAVKRTAAVQQRFKLSLSQLREACSEGAGGWRTGRSDRHRAWDREAAGAAGRCPCSTGGRAAD